MAVLEHSYKKLYDSLSLLREEFHKSGRFDDSNAKIDEVVKIIAVYVAEKRGLISDSSSLFTADLELFRNGNGIVDILQNKFQKTVQLPCYRNQDGSSIFGSNPQLLLHETDQVFAQKLLSLIGNSLEDAFQHAEGDKPFDILNEAFGHFVRDNFRSNIEDAQYMTPPEVVDFMVDVVLSDILKDNNGRLPETLRVLDPSCGVGSFLTAFYKRASRDEGSLAACVKIYGQDKVDRMVRLCRMNMILFEAADYHITIGNSILPGSPLDKLNGKIDIVLSNPPFNAKFSNRDISQAGRENLPLLYDLGQNVGINVDSELLFIDRSLSLLKEGGHLLIIVPDSVISSKGTAQLLRERLKHKATVRAIIELPSVTFAQAGTRTKTAILHILKRDPGKVEHADIFMAKSELLGFEVSSKKGVPVKIKKGVNDLEDIARCYKIDSPNKNGKHHILSSKPSCLRVDYSEVINTTWTPNHYSVDRFESIISIEQQEAYQAVLLGDLVEFLSQRRKREFCPPESKCISVRHVIGEGMLDVNSMLDYAPKTPGLRCYPGEILFSKINPRIPRVLIVPDFGIPLTCSTEFEIMKPAGDLDSYSVVFLLLIDLVQAQIRSLTSGTSASHNRIRTSDLARVRIPVPKPNSESEKRLHSTVAKYRVSIEKMIEKTWEITEIRRKKEWW